MKWRDGNTSCPTWFGGTPGGPRTRDASCPWLPEPRRLDLVSLGRSNCQKCHSGIKEPKIVKTANQNLRAKWASPAGPKITLKAKVLIFFLYFSWENRDNWYLMESSFRSWSVLIVIAFGVTYASLLWMSGSAAAERKKVVQVVKIPGHMVPLFTIHYNRVSWHSEMGDQTSNKERLVLWEFYKHTYKVSQVWEIMFTNIPNKISERSELTRQAQKGPKKRKVLIFFFFFFFLKVFWVFLNSKTPSCGRNFPGLVDKHWKLVR